MSKKCFYFLLLFLLGAISVVSYFLFYPKTISDTSTLSHPDYIHIQPNSCPEIGGEVNLVLITDSRYIVPTSVSMLSAIQNKCANSIYNFYIIAENITQADENFLLQLKNKAPETVNITIIPQKEPDIPFENMQRFLQYKVGMHKIFLPNILNNLDKVIYMDGDTLVLKDLRPLFNNDIQDVYAMVAKDGIYYRFPKEMAELGLDKRGYYFNSGVMLYNLALQRQDDIVPKLVDYIQNNQDFYGDQDVLNMVFGNKLKLMSYKYNCISTFFEADDLDFLSHYFGEKLPTDTFYIYENSSILHYAGDKPWADNFQPLYLKELWFRYYNQLGL